MTSRCRPGDLACFILPARVDLLGRFVTIMRDEPVLSALMAEQIWTVRLAGDAVPCECSGRLISEGIAFDICLQPIRPGARPVAETRETLRQETANA